MLLVFGYVVFVRVVVCVYVCLCCVLVGDLALSLVLLLLSWCPSLPRVFERVVLYCLLVDCLFCLLVALMFACLRDIVYV